MARQSTPLRRTVLVLFLALGMALLFTHAAGTGTRARALNEDDDVSGDSSSGAMDDTADEEAKFYKELKGSEVDVRIKEQALRAAEAKLRAFHMDDSEVREVKRNYSDASLTEEEAGDDAEVKNGTLVEAEKELALAKKLANRTLHKEAALASASRKANLTYRAVLGNVTHLKVASAMAEEHVQAVTFAEAKQRAALVLKDAVAKVAALKRVAAGHHIFETLRDQLAEIKKHKQAKDLEGPALAGLIATAKETAKGVRSLREEMEEARETTEDAKKKLDALIKEGKAPEGALPGPEADKYLEKVRTIKDWIAALDLKHAGVQKNVTTMRLVKYRAKKLKAALAMLAQTESAEAGAKANYTAAEEAHFNSTLGLAKAKHAYQIKHTTFGAEKVLETDQLHERIKEAKFALSAAKQKLGRMREARASMEAAKRQTEESSKQLEKTTELAKDVQKDDPFVPPRLRNSGDIDLAPPGNNPMDVATRELVWGDGKGAEHAFSAIVHDMEAKAKKDAQKELQKSVPIEQQQAAIGKALKHHPLAKAAAAGAQRFKESHGWVEPRLNENSDVHRQRFAAIKAHLARSTATARAHAMVWKAGGRLAATSRTNSKAEDHSKWTVLSDNGVFAADQKAEVLSNFDPLKAQPSHCYDGRKDFGEAGVDCGGACVRKCGLHHVQTIPDKDTKYHHVTIVPNRSAKGAGVAPEIVKKLTDCDQAGTRCTHATDLNDPNLRVVSEKH